MGGSSAPQAAPDKNASAGQQNLTNLAQAQQALKGNAGLTDLLNNFAGGKVDLNTLMQGLSSANLSIPGTPATTKTIGSPVGNIQIPDSPGTAEHDISAGDLEMAAFSNPLVERQIAVDQAMSDPSLAGLFGAGGLQSQAEQNYAKYGDQYQNATNQYQNDYSSFVNGTSPLYSMNNQDLAAYGQAAGQIARMSANTGQSLAQQLANQGLGAAPSGSAAQGFSTVYGNQMEQLAGLQTQIAQNRINTANGMLQTALQGDVNQQQLAQSGQANSGALASNLGSLGENAISNAAAQNYNNINQFANINEQQAGIQQQNQSLQQNIANEAFAQQQQTSLGGMLGGALSGALGSGVGGLAGGLGSNLAGNIIKPATQTLNITGSGSAGGTPALGSYFSGASPYTLQNQ